MRKILLILAVIFLSSCATNQPEDEYVYTGSGLDWTKESGSEGTPTYISK
jgi:hypothetical protein